MKLCKKVTLLCASVLLTLPVVSSSSVHAATFSKNEQNQIKNYQQDYAKLDKTQYSKNTLYQTKPNFADPYNSGKLNPQFVQSAIDYINYYRRLAGLNPETTTDQANQDAQTAAGALAASNAPASLKDHGLQGIQKPDYIDQATWEQAELITFGNLAFDTNQTFTPGQIITDLVQDNTNLAGATNTGHRDLILSARATKSGIGAAVGNNGTLYAVQNGVFADDITQSHIWADTAFPNAGVFPIELIQNKTVPWSLYLGNKEIAGTPSITITDNDTGKVVYATNVDNRGRANYAYGYLSTITYLPGNVNLLVDHQYTVNVGNDYQYSFKLFSLNPESTTSSDPVSSPVNHNNTTTMIINNKKDPSKSKVVIVPTGNSDNSSQSTLLSSKVTHSQNKLPDTGVKTNNLSIFGMIALAFSSILALIKKEEH